MPKVSAGLLLYRMSNSKLEVLLVHPGGPFWAKKDLGAWSVPKGEANEGEELLAVARREVSEEIGAHMDGPTIELGEIRQKGGKLVNVWAIEADFDPLELRSNTFEMEWPPRSGRMQKFPEVDRAEWFSLPAAREKILGAQTEFLDRLEERIRTARKQLS